MDFTNDTLVFLCVDSSKNSLCALQWFYEHYYQRDHVIGLVHIHSPRQNSETADRTQMDASLQESSAIIQQYLDLCATNGIKVKIFSTPKSESIGRTICDLVKEHRPSSVVMGQRGLGTIKRTIYGSVSDYVLHHAKIPVLIVPPEKEQKK